MKNSKNKTRWIYETYQLDKPFCIKCGLTDTEIDLHHIDSKSKLFNPSKLKSYMFYKREASKCIPLCKECHMALHKANGGTRNRTTANFTINWIMGA